MIFWMIYIYIYKAMSITHGFSSSKTVNIPLHPLSVIYTHVLWIKAATERFSINTDRLLFT